jgi:hypothetical protein
MSWKHCAVVAAVTASMGLASMGARAQSDGIVRTYSLPTYSSEPASSDEAPQQVLQKGAVLVLWSLACEPSTAGTSFDNPSTSACVPAKLNLPEEAMSPTGGSARAFMTALTKCMNVTVKKAPDDVVAAADRFDDAFINQKLAAEKTPTMTLVARVTYEEGRNFEVSMNTGGFTVPLPVDQGALTLNLVAGPKARAIDRALQAGDAKKALAIAKAAVKSARKLDDKIRALGNLALAAAFAEDKSAMPVAPEETPDELSDAATIALENIADLDAWRTTPTFTFHASGC